MKIILSRKGCDSSSGASSSVIFPNDRILSLPIPDPHAILTYRDVATSAPSYATIADVCDAMGLPLGDRGIHLDPDLASSSRPRKIGWLPTFGQDDAAETHLRNQGVSVGDLFLFFGWFRDFKTVGKRLLRVRGGRDIYVIFGWMQVGQIIRLGEGAVAPPWTDEHPHHFGARSIRNTLYIASEDLRLPGIETSLLGAGTFDRLVESRVLTAPDGRTKSMWRLPAWFMNGGPALSFHEDTARWTRQGDEARLNVVGRGQEFVLDASRYPEAIGWAYDLLTAQWASR